MKIEHILAAFAVISVTWLGIISHVRAAASATPVSLGVACEATLAKDDEVLKFVDRVNAAAMAKDYWKTDFRRAQYDAFNEVCSQHILDKYNHGQPFKWK